MFCGTNYLEIVGDAFCCSKTRIKRPHVHENDSLQPRGTLDMTMDFFM